MSHDHRASSPQFIQALIHWARQLLAAHQDAAKAPSLSSLLEMGLSEGDSLAIHWQELQRRAELSDGEMVVLGILVAQSEDYDFAVTLRESWDDPQLRALPVGFAASLACGIPGISIRTGELLCGQLFRGGLIGVDRNGHPLSTAALSLNADTYQFLAGQKLERPGLEDASELPLPPPRLKKDVGRRLGQKLGSGPVRIALLGSADTGGFELAAQLALAVGGQQRLLHLHLFERGTELTEIFSLALTTGALLLVDCYGGQLDNEEHKSRLAFLSERLAAFPAVPAVFIGSPELSMNLRWITPTSILELSYPLRDDRRAAWSAALNDTFEAATTDVLLDQLAGSFLLSEPQIARATRDAQVAAANGEPLEDALLQACRKESQTGIGALAIPETGQPGLDALVLDQVTRTLLHELRSYAKHRDVLTEQWGFGDKLRYGLGLTALFTGPPGTGKTMAALGLGTELGLEVFRVETSQLVSKYIGETEKHLGQLFDAAERGGIILVFDECDSLFGKRTDIKSSVDRYANLAVNYLLQRLERFTGIAVLTTNHETAVDEAFVRRIRFRIRFDEPDFAQRKQLWHALLPKQVPLSDDVDLDALAEDYELSGGHIKEVMLRASSLALKRDESVSQADFLRAADSEYRKMGKLALSSGGTNDETVE